MKKHVGLKIDSILEKGFRSRFVGDFEKSISLTDEINKIKNENILKMCDIILNSNDNSIVIEKEYKKRIGNLYESKNNKILGGVTCNTIRIIFGINRNRGYLYFKNAFPIPYKGFDEKHDRLEYTIFPQ